MKKTILLCLALLAKNLFAQNDSSLLSSNIFERLLSFDPLEVVVETDLKKLRNGDEGNPWQPAVFKIMDKGQVAFKQNVQIAPRGNMRRKTCDFPPVKIRFYEGDLSSDSLEDINELKLVVGCRNTDEDDQLVLKEYLSYLLYNLLTEQSFRAKLATVNIRQTGSKKKGLASTAIFIESERELATRLGGKPLKTRILSQRVLDSLAFDRMCLFQFMIGNTDFSAYSRHNVKVILLANHTYIPVPYDFDYAGLVSADYAVPGKHVPIQKVQERYYLGYCREKVVIDGLLQPFLQKKNVFLAASKTIPGLRKNAQREAREYLASFFDIIENEGPLRRQILETCEKPARK